MRFKNVISKCDGEKKIMWMPIFLLRKKVIWGTWGLASRHCRVKIIFIRKERRIGSQRAKSPRLYISIAILSENCQNLKIEFPWAPESPDHQIKEMLRSKFLFSYPKSILKQLSYQNLMNSSRPFFWQPLLKIAICMLIHKQF